jgi:hypothetical protein
MERLPGLIIAGVNKAGTTSIFSYLSAHPDVCASSVKETCYYLPARYGRENEPLSVYQAFFAHCKSESLLMESTPGYFYGGRPLAELIDQQNPGVKIILIFRNPVDRLLSFYKFKQAELELDAKMTLSEYLDACESKSDMQLNDQKENVWTGLENGKYAKHIEGWMDVFGDRLQIVFFDQLRSDSRLLMEDLANWLGIDPIFFSEAELGVENKTVGYRNRRLQRLALAVNRGGERLFRANPGLKKSLRKVYYLLNGKPLSKQTQDADRARLELYYEKPNQEFASILKQKGYDRLPDWLTQTEEI